MVICLVSISQLNDKLHKMGTGTILFTTMYPVPGKVAEINFIIE